MENRPRGRPTRKDVLERFPCLGTLFGDFAAGQIPFEFQKKLPKVRDPFLKMVFRHPELCILSGTAHRQLAQRICAYIGRELADATVTSFPDGETFVKINENIRGRDVFIVQPTCPPTNQNLMELLIMVDAARRASAARITAVIPFFGYARQDRKDQPRVPITAKLVANLLTAAGVSRVLTMDLHAQQVAGFFDIPVDHLYASPVMIRYLRSRDLSDLIVVSPDVGGLKMAQAYAQALNTGLAIVAKRRKSPTETEAVSVIGDVEGKRVFLVDDLTETAGTLSSAARLLREHGASEIFAGVSHAVLTDVAIKRLKSSPIRELITTNSVPVRDGDGFPITTLCIAELLGEGIKRIHDDESVTSLFKISET
jgi:ribose-phosphate pyrophosphokinase